MRSSFDGKSPTSGCPGAAVPHSGQIPLAFPRRSYPHFGQAHRRRRFRFGIAASALAATIGTTIFHATGSWPGSRSMRSNECVLMAAKKQPRIAIPARCRKIRRRGVDPLAIPLCQKPKLLHRIKFRPHKRNGQQQGDPPQLWLRLRSWSIPVDGPAWPDDNAFSTCGR
jgi:hypothetical protein